MWSLRRAALPLKLHGSWLGLSRVISGYAKSEMMNSSVGDIAGTCTLEHFISGKCSSAKEFYHTPFTNERLFQGRCGYCSQAGEISENDELENGFSELDTCSTAEIVEERNVKEVDGEDLLSVIEFLDAQKGCTREESEKKKAVLELLDSIIGVPNGDISNVLNKWDKQGNALSQGGINIIIVGLKKRRMYWKALQFSEWLEKVKRIDFTEQHYASRIDLISKALNVEKAEKFVDKIQESLKGELVYRALLGSFVEACSMTKAEAVFKKMRELQLPITVDTCNQMIILYKRFNKKKIADILLIMEKENIQPSLLTYKLLIDSKGESNDIMGMEQLIESMKAKGIEPDINALTVMAKHYISGGFKHNAQTVLEEIEERKLKGVLGARKSLLLLYASLGRVDEVGKIWKDCESDLKLQECIAAIEAWGKLGKVEEAEAVFDMMLHKWERLSSRQYSPLFNVYLNNKLLTKGKDLVKRMEDTGLWICPLTWDVIVRLYIEAGEVEEADSILLKAAEAKKLRPWFKTYFSIMEQYAKRGDIHNTEKLFQCVKKIGCIGRLKPFEVLIQAYINAKTPAYGFRERMKADNVFPNNAFAKQLAQADPFRRTTISNLLD